MIGCGLPCLNWKRVNNVVTSSGSSQHAADLHQQEKSQNPILQVAAAIFVFRGTVMTKRSNFAADIDVWRNANRDLYFAARAVKHIRLEMAQLQRQYPGVQWGFFCTGTESKLFVLSLRCL